MPSLHPFAAVFLIALTLTTALRLWLATRHILHVASHRALVPTEFSGIISLSSHEKAADYTIAKTRLGIIDTLVGAAVLLAFTLGGGLEALAVGLARVFAPGGYVHGIAFILSVMAVSSLFDLPFGLYRTFVIEARFGFNRMTLALYFADLGKQILLGLAIGVPLLAGVLWLMAQMGSHWWLWAWAAWVAFSLLMTVVGPTLIMPLFNKFSPLEDVSLRERIHALLAKCGFRAQGLYVMDSSRRSSHGNAFFTGFGAARRIVLFDTLIQRLAPPEIEAVLAHELGHFSRHHVQKRMLLMFTASLLFFALLGYLINQDWFYSALHVDSVSTAIALMLFVMIVPVFTFALQPLTSLYSRSHEYEADAYAARHASASNLVQALVKLYQDNAATLTPDPLHSSFYDSHPPAALRIARLRHLAAI